MDITHNFNEFCFIRFIRIISFINFHQYINFYSTHHHTVDLVESHYFQPEKSLRIFPLALPPSFIICYFICRSLKMQFCDANCVFSVSTIVTQCCCPERWFVSTFLLTNLLLQCVSVIRGRLAAEMANPCLTGMKSSTGEIFLLL